MENANGKLGLPKWLVVKNLSANEGDTRDSVSIPGSGRSPGGGNGKPTPVFLPGASQGQRSLADGHKESDTTEHIHTHTHTHTHNRKFFLSPPQFKPFM